MKKSVRILRNDSRIYPNMGQPPNQYSVHLAQNLWPILFEGRGEHHWYHTSGHAKKHFAITNYPKDNHYMSSSSKMVHHLTSMQMWKSFEYAVPKSKDRVNC